MTESNRLLCSVFCVALSRLGRRFARLPSARSSAWHGSQHSGTALWPNDPLVMRGAPSRRIAASCGHELGLGAGVPLTLSAWLLPDSAWIISRRRSPVEGRLEGTRSLVLRDRAHDSGAKLRRRDERSARASDQFAARRGIVGLEGRLAIGSIWRRYMSAAIWRRQSKLRTRSRACEAARCGYGWTKVNTTR